MSLSPRASFIPRTASLSAALSSPGEMERTKRTQSSLRTTLRW